MYTTCSPHVLSLEFPRIELVIYGLVDAKIKASDKDLPVQNAFDMFKKIKLLYLLLFLYTERKFERSYIHICIKLSLLLE